MAYYEQQCPRSQREAYGAIARGVTALESAIRIPLLPMEQLSGIYSRLRLDHPEIFYLCGFRVRSMPGADYGELLPEYLFAKDKILTHQKAIRTRAERLTRDLQGKSDSEKLRFLHSFITDNVRYDKLKKQYSHEVIGPLTQGVGVCESIAKTVKLLADMLKIDCIVALTAPAEGKKYGHAWNIVRLSGKWYHLDATYDLGLCGCGQTRWDYFLLPDERIYRDHDTPVYPVPPCTDSDAFYYKTEKLSFTKTEEVFKRVEQAVKKKRSHFVFHWRGGYLNRDITQELVRGILTACQQAGKGGDICLNRSQGVFCITFTDRPAPLTSPREEDEALAEQMLND